MSAAARWSRRTTLLAAVILPSFAAGCDQESGPLQVKENSFSWTGVIAPGNAVRVRELQGGIDVVPSADDTVRVTARTEWRRGNPEQALGFSGTQQDGDLLVCALWGEGVCSRDAYNASVKVGRSYGDRRTDAKVYFRVELPAGVELDLVSMNGDISAAASAPVLARTLNGDVRIATAVGPVRGESMNGSVDIRMASITGTDTVEARTINGDAFVYLPDAIDAAVDMSVTNGSVSTEFPVMVRGEQNPRRLKATLGQGTHPVLIRSVNGTVALRRLNAQGKSGAP